MKNYLKKGIIAGMLLYGGLAEAQERQIAKTLKIDGNTKSETYLVDLDGDNRDELVQFVGSGGNNIGVEAYISKLNSEGKFVRETKPFVQFRSDPYYPYSAAWKDLDKDGDLDLIVSIIPSVSINLRTLYFENDVKGNFTNKDRVNMSNYKN